MSEVGAMNKYNLWLAIPTAIMVTLGGATAALSQARVAITPGSQTIELKGISGGSQKDKSCAGYIASTPNHMIQVEADTNLRLTLQAPGQPALLIRSPSGQEFCVPADSYSGGRVDMPGRWTKGVYAVFVGDRANGQNPYTLSITPN